MSAKTALTRLSLAYGSRDDLRHSASAWLASKQTPPDAPGLAIFVDRFIASRFLKTLLVRPPDALQLQAHGLVWSIATVAWAAHQSTWSPPEKKIYPAWEPLGLSYKSFHDDVLAQWQSSHPEWKAGGARVAPLSLMSVLVRAIPEPSLLLPLLAFLEFKTSPEAGPRAGLLMVAGAAWVEGRKIDAAAVVGCWKALADLGLDDGDVAALWYDPAVDTRQKASSLTIQLKILPKVVEWFRARDPGLVAKVMHITRDFLRLTGLSKSQHLVTILKAFQEFWYLDLAEWVDEGAKLIRLHGDSHVKVVEWFTRESQGSQQMWRRLDTALHFDAAKESTALFLSGLLERTLPLVPNSQGQFWTDNQSIGLPDHYGPTQNREQNQMLWRHSCAHEAAHILYGSFDRNVARHRATLAHLVRLFPDLYEQRRFDIPQIQKQIAQVFCEALGPLARVEVDDLFGPDMASHLTLLLHVPRFFEAKFLHNVFEDWRIERLLYSAMQGLAKERAERDRIEGELRPPVPLDEDHEGLVQAVFYYVLFGRSPGQGHAWDKEWDEILALIGRFHATHQADVWHSWRITAEVCAVIDRFFRRTNERDWDLSRDLPFQLILESITLLLQHGTTGSGEAQKAAAILGKNPIPELTLIGRTRQKGEREGSLQSRFGAVSVDGKNQANSMFMKDTMADPVAVYSYPEWSREKLDYLPKHCLVGEYGPEVLPGDPIDLFASLGPASISLQKAFQKLRPQAWTDRRNEEDGDEWDFDALFDGLMDFRAGQAWEQDFSIRREKKVRDVVTAILLDASASTSARTPERKTLFRCEQEAAFLMGQALSALGDRFGVCAGFDFGPSSNLFVKVKDFDAPWDRRAVSSLGSMGPPAYGFSRMAPALRHMIYLLGAMEAKTKVVFFVTDGLPFYFEGITDEGKTADKVMNDGVLKELSTPVPVVSLHSMPEAWARDDLLKVVEEAQLAGVHLFGVNLNVDAQPFMEKVFGRRALYVPEARLLAPRLLEVFKKVTL